MLINSMPKNLLVPRWGQSLLSPFLLLDLLHLPLGQDPPLMVDHADVRRIS